MGLILGVSARQVMDSSAMVMFTSPLNSPDFVGGIILFICDPYIIC